ncbi:MAG: ribosome biogenesis GTPase A [Candidatus Tyloplasma litorale]|nr:MAG: ribosome biogenesis GTPase A [Mycoplasmatales bacterium]
MSKQIQWFPGHMSKTLKEFKEIKADIYFVLLDARAPESSFVDSFNEIIKNKKVIIFLTKSDLVDSKELKYWIDYYNKKYDFVKAINFKKSKFVKNEIIKILEQQKIKSLIPKIIVLGAPNVGKSTLLNIVIGSKKTKTENRPGVTKKNDWYQFNKKYWILDTPGVLQPKFITEKQGINLASIGSINLKVLPLEEVAIGLLKRLSELEKIQLDNPEQYLKKLIESKKKRPNDIYEEIIRNYQNSKYGKIILD